MWTDQSPTHGIVEVCWLSLIAAYMVTVERGAHDAQWSMAALEQVGSKSEALMARDWFHGLNRREDAVLTFKAASAWYSRADDRALLRRRTLLGRTVRRAIDCGFVSFSVLQLVHTLHATDPMLVDSSWSILQLWTRAIIYLCRVPIIMVSRANETRRARCHSDYLTGSESVEFSRFHHHVTSSTSQTRVEVVTES